MQVRVSQLAAFSASSIPSKPHRVLCWDSHIWFRPIKNCVEATLNGTINLECLGVYFCWPEDSSESPWWLRWGGRDRKVHRNKASRILLFRNEQTIFYEVEVGLNLNLPSLFSSSQKQFSLQPTNNFGIPTIPGFLWNVHMCSNYEILGGVITNIWYHVFSIELNMM